MDGSPRKEPPRRAVSGTIRECAVQPQPSPVAKPIVPDAVPEHLVKRPRTACVQASLRILIHAQGAGGLQSGHDLAKQGKIKVILDTLDQNDRRARNAVARPGFRKVSAK